MWKPIAQIIVTFENGPSYVIHEEVGLSYQPVFGKLNRLVMTWNTSGEQNRYHGRCWPDFFYLQFFKCHNFAYCDADYIGVCKSVNLDVPVSSYGENVIIFFSENWRTSADKTMMYHGNWRHRRSVISTLSKELWLISKNGFWAHESNRWNLWQYFVIILMLMIPSDHKIEHVKNVPNTIILFNIRTTCISQYLNDIFIDNLWNWTAVTDLPVGKCTLLSK